MVYNDAKGIAAAPRRSKEITSPQRRQRDKEREQGPAPSDVFPPARLYFLWVLSSLRTESWTGHQVLKHKSLWENISILKYHTSENRGTVK